MTQPKENPSLRLTATYVLASQDGTVLTTDETTQRHLSYNEVFDEQGYLHKEKLAVVLDKLERDTAKMS